MTPDRLLWDNGRESLDEIVVSNVDLHLEQMSDDCYWMGIYREVDGKRQALMVNVYLMKKGRKAWLECTLEDDSDPDHAWEWPGGDEEHPA